MTDTKTCTCGLCDYRPYGRGDNKRGLWFCTGGVVKRLQYCPGCGDKLNWEDGSTTRHPDAMAVEQKEG